MKQNDRLRVLERRRRCWARKRGPGAGRKGRGQLGLKERRLGRGGEEQYVGGTLIHTHAHSPKLRTLEDTNLSPPTCQTLWGDEARDSRSEWQGSNTTPQDDVTGEREEKRMRQSCAASTWPGAAQILQLPESWASQLPRRVSVGAAGPDQSSGTRAEIVYGIVLSAGPQGKRNSYVILDQKGDQHRESPRGHWSLQVTRHVRARTDPRCAGRGGGKWPPQIRAGVGLLDRMRR